MTLHVNQTPNFSVLFTGIDRPHCVVNAICSIRKYFPKAEVLYGDQDAPHPQLEEFCARHDTNYVPLSHDCGLAEARNILLDKISHKYFLLIDDDHVIHQPRYLCAALQFLEATPEACIVGGDFINYLYGVEGRAGQIVPHSYSYVLTHDRDLGVVVACPPEFAQRKVKRFKGFDFTHVDIVHNFFVANKPMLDEMDLRWDGAMKIGGEHLDFFLRLQELQRYEVYYLPQLTVQHHRFISDSYKSMRQRPIGADIFDEKWQMKGGIFYVDNGVRYPGERQITKINQLRSRLGRTEL